MSRGVGITSGSTGDQAALSSDAQPGGVNADALVPLGPGEVVRTCWLLYWCAGVARAGIDWEGLGRDLCVCVWGGGGC